MAAIPIVDDPALKMLAARACRLTVAILKSQMDGCQLLSSMRERVNAHDAGRMQ